MFIETVTEPICGTIKSKTNNNKSKTTTELTLTILSPTAMTPSLAATDPG